MELIVNSAKTRHGSAKYSATKTPRSSLFMSHTHICLTLSHFSVQCSIRMKRANLLMLPWFTAGQFGFWTLSLKEFYESKPTP